MFFGNVDQNQIFRAKIGWIAETFLSGILLMDKKGREAFTFLKD